MEDRLFYLDNLKGVCIILVVFSHFTLLSSDTILGNVFMSLAWAAVPCFMLVTGFLLHKKDNFSWDTYKTKLISIYLIVIIWRVIYILVNIVLNGYIYKTSDLIKGILLISNVTGINMDVFWYMKAYIVVYLIYPVTWFLLKNNGKKVLLSIMVLSGLSGILVPSINIFLSYFGSFNIMDFNSFMPYVNYSYMIFYFCLGAFIFEYKTILNDKVNNIMPFGILLFGLLMLILEKYIETGCFRWNNIYISYGYNRISTVIMSVGLFMIFQYCFYKSRKNIFGTYIGQATMGIYFIHYILLEVLEKIVYPHITEFSFLNNLVKTIVVIIISSFITFIIRKIPIVRKITM